MNERTAQHGLDDGLYAAERIDALEKDAEATGASLRDTAKWIISGIAVATAGVIAATSLSALGSVPLDWRFVAAIVAAGVGYLGLGYLFAASLAVIVPRNHSLSEIATGTDLPKGWKEAIEKKLAPTLPKPFKSLAELSEYADGGHAKAGTDRSLVNFNMILRRVRAAARVTEHDLQFRRLKRRTFATTPFIAIAFIVFSWAANPPKMQDVPVMEKAIDVDAGDLPLLSKIFSGTSACGGSPLRVIVLGEWPTGVQDVVTVPSTSCPPIRLRLDHGRISAAK